MVFFELGLLITISVVLIAFEWTSSGLAGNVFDVTGSEDIEEDIIPITRQKEPEPPKPPEPPKVIEVLSIVDDDIELDDEIFLEDFEIDQDTELEIVLFEEEEEEEEEEIFFIVEDMPLFRGKGMGAFYEYISQSLEYPQIAMENGISGKVFISFNVNSEGRVENARVVRGVDPALDAEALRVICSCPDWSPGRQRGKPVKVNLTLPISFTMIQ